jgi:serine/threonine protein kinase
MEKGQRLGAYEIIQAIGAGGMGEVYKARDTRLGRTVAIKVLKGQFSDRFEREARAISTLNHPNICTLYDIGPNYLVMEYIEGTPVKGPLPLDEALKVAALIADALDAAHRQGIVHRDLKPANILLTKSGPKLLDFGLAKQTAAVKTALADETVTQAATLEGAIIGTLQYMAPEQLQGHEADARSDIFAFGLVFYELLTGRPALTADNPASLIAAILTAQPPPVAKFLPLAPPALDRVLQRAIAKDPEDRWQSAGDLKAAIELVDEAGNFAAPAPPPVAARKPSRVSWIVAGAVALAGGVIGWIHWNEKPQPAPLVRFTVDPPSGERFLRYDWPRVSPDGQQILFGAAGPSATDQPRLWIHHITSGESAPFRNLPYSFARWSPDSNAFALSQDDKVVRIDLTTGAQSEILRERISDFAWGPAGSYLFGIREKGLFWNNASGRKQLTVQKPDEGPHGAPQILPDGKSLLFAKQRTTTVETWLVRADGTDPKLLLTTATQALYASPGYLIYMQGDSLLAQRFDAGHGTLIGDARILVTGVARFATISPIGCFSVSENGVLAFRQGSVTNPSRLTWLDRNGNVIGTLGDAADYSSPALSPDGQRLAVGIRDSSGKRHIWVFDLVRGVKTRITFDAADELSPAWSADGSEIAYSSDRRGHRDLYARSSSGTGQERVLLESIDDKSVTDWSADGKVLFYNVLSGKTSRDL